MIVGIQPEQYGSVRIHVRKFLENIASRDLDGTTVKDFETAILGGKMQLWVINAFQGICITQVTRQAVRIEACTGSARREWQQELDDEMRAWAKALGKKRVVGLVRPGWYKWAKTRGYRLAHSQLVIEV